MIKRVILILALLCTLAFAQNGVGYNAINEEYQIVAIPINDPGVTVTEFEYGATVSIPLSWDHTSTDSPDPWRLALGDSIRKDVPNTPALWNDGTASYALDTSTPGEFAPGTYYQVKIRTYGTIRWDELTPGTYTAVKGYTGYSESSGYFLLRNLETAQVPAGVGVQ